MTSLGIEYAIYDPSTGDILEVRKTARLATAEANCPTGKALYIGQANPKSNRIINGEKVERTDRSQDDLSEAITQERDRRLTLGFTWQTGIDPPDRHLRFADRASPRHKGGEDSRHSPCLNWCTVGRLG